MAVILKLFIFVALTTWGTKSMAVDPSLSLIERLQSNESSTCWDSMIEIRSCIGEVVTFLLNGETYLSSGCCNAIKTIVNECRPSMLDVLGFTSEESHVLDDYCEGAEGVINIPQPETSTMASISNSTRAIPSRKGLNP